MPESPPEYPDYDSVMALYNTCYSMLMAALSGRAPNEAPEADQAPSLPHHPLVTDPTSGSLDQNREGKTLSRFLITHFSQPPRHSRAKTSGDALLS
ncbi:unnamed protein product [Rangifer tarandus platyrhynchus]|uniref:Uncharacterized protein n=1 Tax=Rangifer tarandus platyrhynchus TaxID=3082113 RepID=A0ACB1KE91_RANTA